MKRREDGLLQKAITITLPNGQKKRKSFYGRSQSEINKKIIAYTGEIEKGRTLSEVADAWQSEHDKAVRYNTSECYKSPLKDVKAALGESYINQITPSDCQRFINNYASSGKGLKPRARQTVNLRLIVLNQIFKYAVNCGDIAANPAQYTEIPKGLSKTRRLAPEPEQLETVEGNDEGFYLYPMFLLYTGMRKTEALALTWEDINFKTKKITVNKIVEFHGSKPVVRAQAKSEAGEREVPLLKPLEAALRPLKGTGYIFTGKDGLLTKGEFDYRWRKSGLGITAHQLRHAYATKMYEAGIDAESAQVILGVSSVKVVRDIYTHVKNSQIDAAAKALDEIFSKP